MAEHCSSLSDLPYNDGVINDLGIQPYIDGLVAFIRKSDTPITIAIQGEWGSGKTSLMNRLYRDLCQGENAEFEGIVINTWEHSMMSPPELTVYKILAQVVRKISMDGDSKEVFKRFLKGLGSFLYRGGREALKMVPGVGIVLEGANVPTQVNDSKDEGQDDTSISELREALGQSIQKKFGDETGKRGVIVFVDDLDRLNPTVAVEILELLKNVFTIEKCIFVLAIDYDVVVKGLKPKYGELTENNEREFRSFFDKIIQVPFSLPVNDYQPMDFVLKSLVDIGYLTEIDAQDPVIKEQVLKITYASVGKNPRSIKRLLNTLSLIDCIGREQAKNGQAGNDNDGRISNFIVVAIQICYPKIYRMLLQKPGFTSWDREFATRMRIKEIVDSNEDGVISWDEVLESACKPDTFLTLHFEDIRNLLEMMTEIYKKKTVNDMTLDDWMAHLLSKSSVTGINVDFKTEELDKKKFIGRLHHNVESKIRELRLEVLQQIRFKKNTGNGGLWINVDGHRWFEAAFRPTINGDKKVVLSIWLSLWLNLPERLRGKTFDELIQEEKIASAINEMDKVLVPLLHDKWFFSGNPQDWLADGYFKSFKEEARFVHDDWGKRDVIGANPTYIITLDRPDLFEKDQIVEVVAKIIIACYDYWKCLSDFQ